MSQGNPVLRECARVCYSARSMLLECFTNFIYFSPNLGQQHFSLQFYIRLLGILSTYI